MLNVAYYIAEDQGSLFSYSYSGTVLTLDPVASGDHGWDEFLRAYNEYCSSEGGVPLFNQTKWISPKQARKAFGDRIDQFRAALEKYDPEQRMVNTYFRDRFFEN